jgi:hypothetical protein
VAVSNGELARPASGAASSVEPVCDCSSGEQ